ncbi:hypothetical protein CCO03_09530 [Comamonas serinivorans]|uniref:Chorismate-utilising enzyme C-terminal domain-containing protein n=1 Tax=Comamonas serinivorans TaxID=1082851 RepID=A0A1Y0ENJ7_9BURK|nr:chorismate-binding protein [Comamonas serinivorans]ARU04889.1 hypothetical protein CCO03_09530 [Comamonas serinivorans]
MNRPFVLLDDHLATAEAPCSRLYTGLQQQWVFADAPALQAGWPAVQAAWRAGLHAVLFIDYGWNRQAAGLGGPAGPAQTASARSDLRVLVFDTLTRLSADQVEAQLAAWDTAGQPQAPAPAMLWQPQASCQAAQHAEAVARIQDGIRAGAFYQVNHTLRLRGRLLGTPVALYRRLRRAQPVRHGVLARLPHDAPDAWVLSCSPELFVESPDGRQLTARPMKGTAPRAAEAQADAAQARWLAEDVKNRAENVMIVDLLRNDFGRVAVPGSVRVPALFAVETHASLHAMTSTITAQLRPDVDGPTLLAAVFPCGSITGAPKRAAMAAIDALEGTPRGLYTGAIGWIEPPAAGQACGPLSLSVAIRTLTVARTVPPEGDAHVTRPPDAQGDAERPVDAGAPRTQPSVAQRVGPADQLARQQALRRAHRQASWQIDPQTDGQPNQSSAWPAGRQAPSARRPADAGGEPLQAGVSGLDEAGPDLPWVTLGVGGGIVLDSDPASEWIEALLKARFVTALDPGFTLFETLLWRPVAGFVQPARHLARLMASARALGFRCDEAAWRTLVATQHAQWAGELMPRRVRIDLAHDGHLRLSAAPLPPLPRDQPLALVLAEATLPPDEAAVAGHKTSLRPTYDAAMQAAVAQGAFDALFFNARGELTEGARSTVYVQLDGRWWTPPLACGVLPGTARARLLARCPQVGERVICRDDLVRATGWAVSNALRGVRRAALCEPA